MGVVVRQSIKGMFVNYIGAFIGFLTNFFILTKFLKPEEIGLTRVILDAAILISNIALMGASASAFRFFPFFQNPKNKDNGFFFYLLILPTIGLLLCIPAYLLLKGPISDFFSENSGLFVNYYNWVIPLICITVYWVTFETYANLKMRIAVPKFIREVLVRVMLIIVYLLYALKILNLNGFIACFISVYGISMLISFLYIKKIGDLTLKHDFSFINKDLKRDISKYTTVLILGVLGGGLLYQLDTFMVGSQLSLGHAGIYTIALNMAIIIEIPSRSIASISLPIAAKSYKEGKIDEANALYKKVALHQLIAGGLIFLLLWINIDNIFAIIPNGDIYAAGKWVVFFIALSKLIYITFNFGATLISLSKYYYWTLSFTAIITVIGICANLLLIPKFGITGAAIATLITFAITYTIQQTIVVLKIKGNPLSLNMFKFLILLSAAFALNYLLPVWENPIIDGLYRTIIIGVPTLTILYKLKLSDEITSLVMSIRQRIIK